MTNRHGHCLGVLDYAVLAWCRWVEETQQLHVEHVVEVTAKRWQQRDGGFWSRQSHRYPHWKWYSLDGGPSQGWVSTVYLGKILSNCWRLALRIINDGTTKTRKQRNEKNEKKEVVQKKGRKQTKPGKVQQVMDGGGVQLGTSERPGRCQPSPLRKKIQVKYVYPRVFAPEVTILFILRIYIFF